MNDLQRYTLETVIGKNGYTVDLIASSERAAISIARGTLFHKLRDVRALDAEYEIIAINPLEDVDD